MYLNELSAKERRRIRDGFPKGEPGPGSRRLS